MNEFLQSINNREWAILTWSFIFLIFILYKKALSLKNCKSLLDSFSNKKILSLIFLMVTFVFSTILFFKKISLWDISFLKDVLIWFLFTAFVNVMNAGKMGEFTFKKILFINFSSAVFLKFIMNLYVFSFIVEFFLVLILGVFFIIKMIIENLNDEKIKSGKEFILKITNIFLFFIVLFIFYFSVKSFFQDINDKQVDWVYLIKYFCFIPILTVVFYFFTYLVSVFIKYENLFLGFRYKKLNKKLLLYLRWKIFKYGLFNIGKINEMKPFDFFDFETKKRN